MNKMEMNKGNVDYLLPTISIVIPTLNEAKTIGIVLEEIIHSLKKHKYEIIIVDGGSKDNTKKIALSYDVKIINEKRKSYGYALKIGMINAKGDILVILDGDLTYPGSDIPKLIKYIIDDEFDFINTNRLKYIKEHSMNKVHLIGNKILNILISILFPMIKFKICDSQSGMWLMKRNILKEIMPKSNGMSFSQEIKIRAANKFKVIELPIYYRPRIGESKMNTFSDGIHNLINLIKLRFFL